MSFDAEPGRGQALLVAVAVHHVPERPRRPRLVIADAGVDQDVVVRRLYDELCTHSTTLPVAGSMNVGCSQERFSSSISLLSVGKNSNASNSGASLLDDRVDGDVLERNGCRHCEGLLP